MAKRKRPSKPTAPIETLRRLIGERKYNAARRLMRQEMEAGQTREVLEARREWREGNAQREFVAMVSETVTSENFICAMVKLLTTEPKRRGRAACYASGRRRARRSGAGPRRWRKPSSCRAMTTTRRP